MTDTDIAVGKYYHFEFEGNWSDFTGDYYVAGRSTPDTITLIDSTISLFKTYFENLGLGNDDYDKRINPSTTVILANKITSKNPITKDDSKFVYIPVSLLNLLKCYEYLDAFKLNITVHSGFKHFDNLIDRKKFVKKTIVDIKDVVNKMDDYSGEFISVDCQEVDTITTKSELDKIYSVRESLKNNALKAKMQKQLIQEASERNLYESLNKTKTEKDRYHELANDLMGKINDAEAIRITNEYETTVLNGVRTNMIRMLNMLVSGEITSITQYGNTGEEVFEYLYNLAKENI